MKPSRPISVLHRIALLITAVTCHTACASLLELESFRPEYEQKNLSVRPSELFRVCSGQELWTGLTEKQQAQLNRTEMMRNYIDTPWQQQTGEETLVRYGSQSLLMLETPFKKQASTYTLGCLITTYNKTLLRASYICSTSKMYP